MAKRAFIIHGWDGKPEHGWYPWMKKQLEAKGFHVQLPEMPNTEEPEIEAWVSTLKKLAAEVNEETYFIGHSVGCQTILRFLQTLPEGTKIGGAVLVAPWMHLDQKTIEEEGPEVVEVAKPWMETPIDWEKIKHHKYVAIFSDNDSYVPLSDSKIFEEKLCAKIIIEKEKGHFAGDEGIFELPVALEELLKFAQ